MTGGFGSMRTVRGILVAASLLLGCATARAYKTEAFEMTLGDSTSVIEKRGPQGPEWRFAEPNGPEFLGAARYPIAGDPTFPCGIPQLEVNGAPAFVVRRTTAGRPERVIASLIFPQAEGTVLEFSYLESEETARKLVATVKVRSPVRQMPSCEALRTGGALQGDRYDAGLFSARLLPGTWLLDSRHFEPGDRNSPGGGWYFEQGSTGTIFLSVRGYPRNPHAPARCESGPVIELNGTCAFRCRDTDGLEPYPGPSNVTVTVPVDAGERGRFVLQFEYDEHAPTAHLAEATLESVRVHNPGSNACAR